MHELQRQAYLEALGIMQYCPVRPIEGAPVLPEVPWPDITESESEEPVEPIGLRESESLVSVSPSPEIPTQEIPTDPTPTEEGDDAIPLLDISRIRLESDRQPAVSRARQQSHTSSTRFAMVVLTLNNRLRFLVQLAQYSDAGLSAAEHVMLADLLRALGYPDWLSSQNPGYYRWPLVNNPTIARDTRAAKEAFFGYCVGLPAVEQNVFLGMGVLEATGLMADRALEEQPQAVSFNRLSIDALGDCLFGPSLSEMNQSWQKKAAFWQALSRFLSSVDHFPNS